jgi:hypothetical protein
MGVTIDTLTDNERELELLRDGAAVDDRNPMPESITAVDALELGQGSSPRVSVNCAVANTDAEFAAVVPVGTKYAIVMCAAAGYIALGESTAANGDPFPAGFPTPIRLRDSDVAAGKKLHAQASAAAVVNVTYKQA